MTDISRRRLLEGTLAGGAIALTGVAQARTSDEPKQWDATYDDRHWLRLCRACCCA